MPYENQENVNTDGISLYGDSCLRADWWNQFISIKMFPQRPEAERSATGGTKYEYRKNRVQLTISPDNAEILARWIDETFIPACKEQKEASFGVTSGRINLVYLSTHQNGEFNPYIAIFVDLAENRVPAKQMFYHFQSRRVITLFNVETGEYTTEESFIYDIEVLAAFLHTAPLIYGAPAHAVAVTMRKKADALDSFLHQAARKLGFEYERAHNYVTRPPRNDPFATGIPDASIGTLQPADSNVSSASSIDDINGLI